MTSWSHQFNSWLKFLPYILYFVETCRVIHHFGLVDHFYSIVLWVKGLFQLLAGKVYLDLVPPSCLDYSFSQSETWKPSLALSDLIIPPARENKQGTEVGWVKPSPIQRFLCCFYILPVSTFFYRGLAGDCKGCGRRMARFQEHFHCLLFELSFVCRVPTPLRPTLPFLSCLLADEFVSLSGFRQTLRHLLPTDTRTQR